MATRYQTSDETNGKILGVRQIQNHGRIQIPKIVRDKLQLSDGDSAYWVEDTGGRIVLRKSK